MGDGSVAVDEVRPVMDSSTMEAVLWRDVWGHFSPSHPPDNGGSARFSRGCPVRRTLGVRRYGNWRRTRR
ncbi:hypothetical protein GCM10025857_22260 [Alicyclobacillus contaminans]|nr:hypothetical protein GCM10025857_22260 [Alicyclobacillus contaminans]